MNAGSIVANIKARIDELKAGVSQAKDELKGFQNQAQDSAKKLYSTGKQMTKYITLPILAVGAMAIRTAAKFEGAMNKVSALSGATGEPLQRLKNIAMEMGRETRYSAVEAAEGLSYLSMAGFDVEQSISALPSVLEMAAAGGMDLAQAADYASNIMTGFGLKAEEMGRVTDVLALTFTSSNTNLAQLAEGMKYVAPIAAGLGMEIEETAAAMGMLGDAGIQGSMAGTTLRTAMMSLMTPTGAAADVINRLKLETTDTQGEFVGLVDIVRQLEDAGASTQDMMELFGARGAGMIALVSQGSEKFAEFTEELENAEGTGKRISEVMLQGLEGSLTILRGSIETLMIVIGERFLPRLTEWADRAIEIVNAMASWSDATWNMIARVAGVAAVMGPLLMIYAKIRMFTLQWAAAKAIASKAVAANTAVVTTNSAALATNTGIMGKLGGLVGSVGAKLAALAAASGPILAVAVVLGVAAAYWHEYSKAMAADYRSFADVVEETRSRMTQSFVDSQLSMIDSQTNAQVESLASQIEFLEEQSSLTRDQKDELAGLYEELSTVVEQAEAKRHGLMLIKEREFGASMADETAETNEKIIANFDDLKQDHMNQLEEWHGERLQAIIDHHVEAGTIGSEAFYKDLEMQDQHFAEKQQRLHVDLGNMLAEYEEQLAELGLVYDQALGELIPITEKNLRDQGKAASEHMEGFKEEYENFGRNNWAAYNKGQKDMEGEVQGTTEYMGELTVRALKATEEPAEQAGKDTVEGYRRGIASGGEGVKTEGTKVTGSLIDAVKSLLGISSASTVFHNIGINIVQGLINGMKSMVSSLISAAVDVVGNAYNSAKNWLESKSPSKKTADLGQDWTAGLAMGITDNLRVVEDAVREVVDASMNFGSGAGGLAVAGAGAGGQAGSDGPSTVNLTIYQDNASKEIAEHANDDIIRKLNRRGGTSRGRSFL